MVLTSCPPPQYLTNVQGPPTAYADAYFELSYIRAFSANSADLVSNGTNGTNSTAPGSGTATSGTTGAGTGTGSPSAPGQSGGATQTTSSGTRAEVLTPRALVTVPALLVFAGLLV